MQKENDLIAAQIEAETGRTIQMDTAMRGSRWVRRVLTDRADEDNMSDDEMVWCDTWYEGLIVLARRLGVVLVGVDMSDEEFA